MTGQQIKLLQAMAMKNRQDAARWREIAEAYSAPSAAEARYLELARVADLQAEALEEAFARLQ